MNGEVVGIGRVVKEGRVGDKEFVGILCWNDNLPFGVIKVKTSAEDFSRIKGFPDEQSAIEGINELIDSLIKSS